MTFDLLQFGLQCRKQFDNMIHDCFQQGHYRFEGAAFPSVAELIAWQRTSGVPVTARSGALLRRAVPRENWELNNDDVQLCDKIGRVRFIQQILMFVLFH